MNAETASRRWNSGPAIVLYLAAAKVLFHLCTANRYGIFRDELYYLACSDHLGAGYVDQPPLIAFVTWLARHLFGESLLGLRLIPALAGGATVWLTGKLAREMGGGRYAQALAALAVVAIPIYLVLHHWLTMNAWEPLLWIACAWCVVRAIHLNAPRYWIWFGVLAGIGMENKYTTAFFLLALALGILVTSTRRFLLTREIWLGALIALAIFLPNFVWLVTHHFPFLELMRNIRSTNRDVVRGPIAFVVDQIVMVNPILAPLWIGGLIWLFIGKAGTQFRLLGIAFVAMLVAFIALRGKNYYIASAYPILLAAGAVGFEQISSARARWMRPVYVSLIFLTAALLAPTVSPILSPESAIAYQKKLGIEPPKAENQETGPLPQYFADEFGWEDMTREVARIYHALPADEQKRTAIFANSYGQAGAIDFFGPRYGLPKSISNHQSYWLWGPRDYDGETVIVLGSNGRGDRKHFATVEVAGRAEQLYSRRDEWYDIYICRGINEDLQSAWPRMKKWN